jgi:hypothetical protein
VRERAEHTLYNIHAFFETLDPKGDMCANSVRVWNFQGLSPLLCVWELIKKTIYTICICIYEREK